MSLVKFKKATFIGLTKDKHKLLTHLQELGCLEIIPLNDAYKSVDQGPSTQARDSLRFLLNSPHHLTQNIYASQFNAEEIEERASQLQKKLFTMTEKRDLLEKKIKDRAPWGDFELPSTEELDGYQIWFYEIPHRQMNEISKRDEYWQVMNKNNRFCYVAIISIEEPLGMPVQRLHLGSRSNKEMRTHLEHLKNEIKNIQAERVHLTQWCYLFARNLDLLEDHANLKHVSQQTLDNESVFALQAWAITDQVELLKAFCKREKILFECIDPQPEENPPTLMLNPESLSAGEGLVNFYMTPGYRTWDPSVVVFFSFAVFFAMILSDAGYALLMGLGLVYFWKKLSANAKGKRWRNMLLALVIASLGYGLMVGSYFGVTPKQDSVFSTFQVLDINDTNKMMLISMIIGGIHVILGSLMDAKRHGLNQSALAPFGWSILIIGGFALGLGFEAEGSIIRNFGIACMFIGALLIVLFTGVGKKPLFRLATGMMALTNITSAFGDVLSYLRLFALGLASASLAIAFNDMAAQIREAVPGGGLFLAILVLFFGHALNFILAIASGVIHGMRLNVIEFFNWSLKEEGKIFKPFYKKEEKVWKHSS